MTDRPTRWHAPGDGSEAEAFVGDRRLARRLARHPLRLVVSVLALGLLMFAYGITRHVERRDADFALALQGQRLAGMRLLAATTRVPLDATLASAAHRAVIAGANAAAHSRFEFDRFDPWVDASALTAAPRRLATLWSEAASAAGRAVRTVDAAQTLERDVGEFQSIARGMLLAADELVDSLVEAESDLQALAAAGRQMMLIQRMIASAGEMFSGNRAALASIDRFGRDAVVLGEVNNAMLNGNPDLGLLRVENDDVRAVVEHMGREFRATTALIERIVRHAGAFATHSSAVDDLAMIGKRVLREVDAAAAAHRQQAALRPPLAELVWLLGAFVLLALAGASLGLHRDARSTRYAMARQGASLAESAEKVADVTDERDRLFADLERLEQAIGQMRPSGLRAEPATTEPMSRRLAAALTALGERLGTDYRALRRQWADFAELVDQLDAGARSIKAASIGQNDLLMRASLTASDVERVARIIEEGSEELTEATRESSEISVAVVSAVRETFADLDTLAVVVKQTGAHVRHVLETTGTVRDMADSIEELGERAKMLSLNVAIAGSMERGSADTLGRFADEVQELADRTRQVNRRVLSVNEALRAAADAASDAIKRGTWSSTKSVERVQALDAPMSRLEQTVRRLERLGATLGPELRDHPRRVDELRRAIAAIAPLLEQLREMASVGVDTVGRLSVAAHGLEAVFEPVELDSANPSLVATRAEQPSAESTEATGGAASPAR